MGRTASPPAHKCAEPIQCVPGTGEDRPRAAAGPQWVRGFFEWLAKGEITST